MSLLNKCKLTILLLILKFMTNMGLDGEKVGPQISWLGTFNDGLKVLV
jgi:hypothetical protein